MRTLYSPGNMRPPLSLCFHASKSVHLSCNVLPSPAVTYSAACLAAADVSTAAFVFFKFFFTLVPTTLKHLKSFSVVRDSCKEGGEKRQIKKKKKKSQVVSDRKGWEQAAEQVQLLSFSSPIQLAAIHLCCHGIPAAQQ